MAPEAAETWPRGTTTLQQCLRVQPQQAVHATGRPNPAATPHPRTLSIVPSAEQRATITSPAQCRPQRRSTMARGAALVTWTRQRLAEMISAPITCTTCTLARSTHALYSCADRAAAERVRRANTFGSAHPNSCQWPGISTRHARLHCTVARERCDHACVGTQCSATLRGDS